MHKLEKRRSVFSKAHCRCPEGDLIDTSHKQFVCIPDERPLMRLSHDSKLKVEKVQPNRNPFKVSYFVKPVLKYRMSQ